MSQPLELLPVNLLCCLCGLRLNGNAFADGDENALQPVEAVLIRTNIATHGRMYIHRQCAGNLAELLADQLGWGDDWRKVLEQRAEATKRHEMNAVTHAVFAKMGMNERGYIENPNDPTSYYQRNRLHVYPLPDDADPAPQV